MIVIYDRYDYPDLEDPIDPGDLKDMTGDLQDHGTSVWAGFDGWKNYFDDLPEKGISKPLMVYDRYQYNTYSLTWNSYIPNELTDCRSFGTSRNYMKNLVNGVAPKIGENSDLYRNDDYWDPQEQCATDKISLATDIGIIATSEGEDITFSAGHDIFRRRGPTQVENAANIIKWYELY